MNLDSRIKDILYIADCFTTDNYQKYVGTECYMTSEISDYSNLDKCIKAVLRRIEDDEIYPYKSDKQTFQFCLASVFVEPKQTELRPFTLSEFTEKFPVGQPIKFRSKGDVVRELYLILLGYRLALSKDQTVPYISIGHFTYLLDELFDHYEWWDPATGGWALFGVEE